MNALQFIFVHGLSGWGSYDARNRKMPYWGMRGGDLMPFLREQGFDCYAASVAPTGSAWDRAAELYAQLTGTRTDYGAAHAKKYRHDRYGPDFTDRPLIPDWNDGTRLVLLGHSFGGATVRMFSELLAHGDEDERQTASSESLSPLFRGGLSKHIHSIVTLASPMNGTTAYDLFLDPDFDPQSVKVPLRSKVLAWMMSKGTAEKDDGRDPRDNANFDMHLDRAAELNRIIQTIPSVYYFSVPCSMTDRTADGTHRPRRGIEPLFQARGRQIGAYIGKSRGGIVVDESWRENDGLVNTVSATAPEGAPSKTLDRKMIEPGLWNVFPAVQGDHMWLQGGLLHQHDIRAFYLDLLTMIRALP
ncbi:MAG: hypothetical protein J6Y95_06685 [Lachnospiraceae bacterium]|nr:hypothetical protein [Lachnospiraceae bacterium]